MTLDPADKVHPFRVGDTVRIKASCAECYKQPWRKWILAGRVATVTGSWSGSAHWLYIRFATKRKLKYPSDLGIKVHFYELEAVDE